MQHFVLEKCFTVIFTVHQNPLRQVLLYILKPKQRKDKITRVLERINNWVTMRPLSTKASHFI